MQPPQETLVAFWGKESSGSANAPLKMGGELSGEFQIT
jgi:hypothetical protein